MSSKTQEGQFSSERGVFVLLVLSATENNYKTCFFVFSVAQSDKVDAIEFSLLMNLFVDFLCDFSGLNSLLTDFLLQLSD